MKTVYEFRGSRRFKFGKHYKTRIWISTEALKKFLDYQKTEQPPEKFIKKLEFYAKNGFKTFEGNNQPIRHEWGGVYRISDRSSLFRLYGFYENDSGDSFIIIDATKKRGQKLSNIDRSRIDSIVEIKKRKLWQKI